TRVSVWLRVISRNAIGWLHVIDWRWNQSTLRHPTPMSTFWTKSGLFHRTGYQSESDLEAAIIKVQTELFGSNRIYLDVKKKIGGKTGPRNIPDGYLIDLSGQRPRLFVVENELASHEPLRHIAVQILEFSLSFEAEPRAIKTILFDALHKQPAANARREVYATS